MVRSDLLKPIVLQLTTIPASILAVFKIIFIQRRPQDLFNLSKFNDQSFGTFWLILAPTLAEKEVESGVPGLVASASGTVIEIGPGSGSQVSRYDRSKVTNIYGIEPTTSLHAKLRENIKKAGLSDIYTIVPCGIQDVDVLRKYGVDQEAFDTVLTVQVFCSIPNPKETAAACWRLLKPGGQMVVYEHVKSHDILSSKVQGMRVCIVGLLSMASWIEARKADILGQLSTTSSGHTRYKAAVWTAIQQKLSVRLGIGQRWICTRLPKTMHG
ncbi:MAG: hypothetical protein Q9186_000874 [Xanthomendoza sp. 1 TL-2023]